jgi:hypothetical protein
MHLKTEPEELKKEDIPELIEWSKLAFAMLTDNEEYVDAFIDDLAALGSNPKRSKKHAESH